MYKRDSIYIMMNKRDSIYIMMYKRDSIYIMMYKRDSIYIMMYKRDKCMNLVTLLITLLLPSAETPTGHRSHSTQPRWVFKPPVLAPLALCTISSQQPSGEITWKDLLVS